jgi:hypothetical protein
MRELVRTSTHSFLVALSALATMSAGDMMPVAQQNALVRKYCTVCHTDAARNGGLSLEHFDAAQVAPSLAAMMLSKLTGGISLETTLAAASKPDSAALVARKMKSGAMGAAGIPIPDKAVIDALIHALATESAGAHEWSVSRAQDPAVVTASILREVLSGRSAGEASMYRLVLTCNEATRQGEMQLSWAPLPKAGTLSVMVDGKHSFSYKVEGIEKMGNGSAVTAGPASINLSHPKIPLPAGNLVFSGLFPNETVAFPFDKLSHSDRQSMAGCFSKSAKTSF